MSESFNEIIRRIRDAAHASEPYALSCLNVLNEICDGVSPTFMQMFDKMCDMLQDAHDRELEQAYDPQRLRGTKPNTFDGALEALREFRWQHATNDTDAIPYINAVKNAHDRELEEASNPSHECMRQTESEHERKLELLREYGRGRLDGIEFADYRRAEVVRRLQAVELNDYEEGFALLNDVCCAIYAPEHDGWTRIQVCELRDALVDLLGRKTSELEQERAEVAERLTNYKENPPTHSILFPKGSRLEGESMEVRMCTMPGVHDCVMHPLTEYPASALIDRLIHLFGGDSNYGKPQKPTIGDAETESNLWDSPKTINNGDLVPKCTGLETLDQERAVVIQRLKEVPFDGLDSHHNLSAIANAVWGAAPVAWSKTSCMALARRLMWLLGTDDEPEEPTADELRDAIAFGLAEAGLEGLCEKFSRLMELLGGEDG